MTGKGDEMALSGLGIHGDCPLFAPTRLPCSVELLQFNTLVLSAPCLAVCKWTRASQLTVSKLPVNNSLVH